MDKKTLNLKDVIIILLKNDKWLESKSGDCNSEVLVVEGLSQRRNHDCHGRSPRSRSKSRPKVDDNK